MSSDTLRYFEVHFNADGTLNTTTGSGDGGLPAAVAAGGITDVFVFSHGWNNGVASARKLYTGVFDLLAGQLGQHQGTCVAVGVIWPSLLFPDDDPDTATPVESTALQVVAAISPAFPDQQPELARMGQLLQEKSPDQDKLMEFHSLAVGLVTTPPQGSEDAGESTLLTADAKTALTTAAAMGPRATSDAQGVGDVFSGLWSGGLKLLRGLSYYEMKNRAGVVGQRGLGPLLATLSGPDGAPRVHLIGHSFGARLVSYALSGLPESATGATSPVKSLSLVQGAFSHFTFATTLPFDPDRPGALGAFVDRVDGPLLATFTSKDWAVGRWYPAASMLAREDSQADDDFTFRWGAMGHDGYQNDPAAQTVTLGDAGTRYDFKPGTFYALDANAVIKDITDQFSGAHSDITHPEVTWAILGAAGLTR